MTPLLNYIKTQLVAAQLPGLSTESITLYVADFVPEYTLPFDPDSKLPSDAPITLGGTLPATLVIKPYAGDVPDLILTLNLILDEVGCMARGNDKRLSISAEPLNETDSILVITLRLRETIRYVPAADGNLTINGIHYKREPFRPYPPPQFLNEIRYVGDD